jgi:hypothetical protein
MRKLLLDCDATPEILSFFFPVCFAFSAAFVNR